MPDLTDPLPKTAQDNNPPRKINPPFYGWWIVLSGTAILCVSSGIGFYGHGVILDPLRSAHGWSKGVISSAVSLYFMTSGIAGMFVGRYIDKYGPKPVLLLGSLVTGISLLLLSFISTIWQLYAVYLLMAIGWCGTSLVPVNTLITNWFIRKRGFAMSLTNTGLSLGGVILVPFAVYGISHWGLKIALPLLGLIYWVVITPIALYFVKRRPSDLNQFPDGKPPGHFSQGEESSSFYAGQMREWTRKQAMGTLAFWAIVVAFILALSGQMAFLIHQVSFLSQFLGISGAATAVSITAGASIVGRLFLGTFVDRSNKRAVTMICFLIQAAAVFTLAYSSHVVVLYLCTFAFGLTMGSIIMMNSLILGECFGLVSFGTVAGSAMLFSMLGAAFGPTVAGIIYDTTQSYQMAFTIFAATSLLAIGAIFFAKPPNPDKSELTNYKHQISNKF